jgi:hypothetical protein
VARSAAATAAKATAADVAVACRGAKLDGH